MADDIRGDRIILTAVLEAGNVEAVIGIVVPNGTAEIVFVPSILEEARIRIQAGVLKIRATVAIVPTVVVHGIEAVRVVGIGIVVDFEGIVEIKTH